MALALLGMEPRSFLSARGDELRILNEVANQAAEIVNQRKREEIDAIGAAVGQAVGQFFGGRSRKRKRKG